MSAKNDAAPTINPQAVKHEVDDAQGFLNWAGSRQKWGRNHD